MQEKSILEIDQAALGLINALENHAADLECCVDMDHLLALHDEVINLRRVLLGLEMGMLYQNQDYDQKVLAQVVSKELKLPIKEAAAKVIDLLHKNG
jgi:hypothetical protein